MTSARSVKKRATRTRDVPLAAVQSKAAVKPQVLPKEELNRFLALHVGEATDTYLRELALMAIQSRHLTRTVAELSAYQRSLAETDGSQDELIEGRYWVANDGTVIDEKNKLMWMQSALEGTFTFDEAQQAAKHLNAKNRFAGYADWRVPSQKELSSLVVHGNSPAICQEAFPETPKAWFWTSTPHTNKSDEAWLVDFSNGRAYDIGRYYYHVRLVRNCS